MKKYENAVLRFAKHPDVAFTNNRAERDLRMSKVKQSPDASAPESRSLLNLQYLSMANQGFLWWPFKYSPDALSIISSRSKVTRYLLPQELQTAGAL